DLLQQLVGNESKVDLIRVRADQDLFRLEHQIDGADADDLLFVGREGWQRAQGTQTVQMLDEAQALQGVDARIGRIKDAVLGEESANPRESRAWVVARKRIVADNFQGHVRKRPA